MKKERLNAILELAYGLAIAEAVVWGARDALKITCNGVKTCVKKLKDKKAAKASEKHDSEEVED